MAQSLQQPSSPHDRLTEGGASPLRRLACRAKSRKHRGKTRPACSSPGVATLHWTFFSDHPNRIVILNLKGCFMTARTTLHRLQVATELYDFIQDNVLPGTGIDSATFWAGFDAIVNDLAPKNAALLAERDRIQLEMDAWHQAHPGPIADMAPTVPSWKTLAISCRSRPRCKPPPPM